MPAALPALAVEGEVEAVRASLLPVAEQGVVLLAGTSEARRHQGPSLRVNSLPPVSCRATMCLLGGLPNCIYASLSFYLYKKTRQTESIMKSCTLSFLFL